MRGGGLQGLLVFTNDNFILKLKFISRALSKIDIQSVKLCKMLFVYCSGTETDLDGTGVSYLYYFSWDFLFHSPPFHIPPFFLSHTVSFLLE